MVAGLRMQFFAEHFSDSEDTLTAWIPEMKLVYNNFLWPALFNFYTLRGDVFRNPASWRNGLKVIRDLEPELLVNTHALPYTGKAEVREALQLYMDAISYMINQTLRGINKGLSPEDLKEFVKLPPHLAQFANNVESYSEFFYFPLHLYHHIFGWYDGDAASIHRMSSTEEATRIVRGFGGAENVLTQYAEAMASGDLIWASRLAGWLLATDRENKTYRNAQAEALRQIAYRSPGTIARHFALTQALQLEGKIAPVTSVLPNEAAILSVHPTRYVDFLRVRLDPLRSKKVQQRLVITLRDRDIRCALEVRRGVCEFIDHVDQDRPGDLALNLDTPTGHASMWAKRMWPSCWHKAMRKALRQPL